MPDGLLVRVLAGLTVVPFVLGAAAAPAQRGQVVCSFTDPRIVEASALVAQDGLVITSNDSGDTGRVFAVDPATGDTVGVTSWSTDPTDVESLAPGGRQGGADTVWVGDIGDNAESRDTVQVARIPVGRGDRTVRPTVYDLAYPDGPHDAETLVRDPVTGRLYVATKGILGGRLYAAPQRLVAGRVNRLVAVAPVLPVATDGAFWPDGRHLLVRNYTALTVYDWPSMQSVATVRLPAQPQGEGLGITAAGQVLLDSEGLHSDVLRARLPADVRRLLDPPASASPSASGSASGSSTSGPASPSAAGGSASAAPSTGAVRVTDRESSSDRTGGWLIAGLVAAVALVVVGGGPVAAGRRRRR